MAEITQRIGISPLLAAIYTRLTTNANTSGYRIYNHAPDSAALPYIVFGEALDRPSAMFSSRDCKPEEIPVMFHIWSEAHGDKDCAEYMDNIGKALTASALSITGFTNLYNAVLEYAEILVDTTEPTRPVRHGVMRWHWHINVT